jgi:hypothetical protein
MEEVGGVTWTLTGNGAGGLELAPPHATVNSTGASRTTMVATFTELLRVNLNTEFGQPVINIRIFSSMSASADPRSSELEIRSCPAFVPRFLGWTVDPESSGSAVPTTIFRFAVARFVIALFPSAKLAFGLE